MSIHILRLDYLGRFAAQGIPSDLEKQVINGAALFLGGHAAYLTEGIVPDEIRDRTPHYALHDVRRGREPFLLEARISFQTDGRYLARLAAQSRTKKAFKALVLDSFDAWQTKQPLRVGFGERVEPILVDAWPEEAAEQNRRLHALVHDAACKITAPIRSVATQVNLSFDGVRMGCIERRIYSDAEISLGLNPLQRVYERRVAA